MFKTRISTPYTLFKGSMLPRTFRLSSYACWYFVYTTPKSDVFQCSAVPDMSIQIKVKFALQ